jgi:hypothetical protein
MKEDEYWRDFFKGLPLDKYGVHVIQTWNIDKFKAAELFMGVW